LNEDILKRTSGASKDIKRRHKGKHDRRWLANQGANKKPRFSAGYTSFH